MAKKLHLTSTAAQSADKLKFFMVGIILVKGSTTGAVTFKITWETG